MDKYSMCHAITMINCCCVTNFYLLKRTDDDLAVLEKNYFCFNCIRKWLDTGIFS